MFDSDNDDHWIPLADLMTGLMVMFLLIAVTIMVDTIERNEQLSEKQHHDSTLVNNDTVNNISADLKKNLGNILNATNVQFESKDLVVRFRGNLSLFNVGSNEITPQFKEQISQFMPMYLDVITKYESQIDSINIDGYASSFWGKDADVEKAYFLNMNLSQQRARSVLEYVYHEVLFNSPQNQEFLRDYFTANGYSSSRFVTNIDGSENTSLSQRVEFKIILK